MNRFIYRREILPSRQVKRFDYPDRMGAASIKDVARQAGVSVGTVSNVLNQPDRVSAETARRVRAAIEELGFVRNDAARQLRAGRSATIGLIVLDISNPFFADLARGAEDAADAAGLSVMIGNSDEKPEREDAYLRLFDEQRARGVLISPIGDVTERLERLRRQGTRAVLVDRSGAGTGFSSVSVDDVAGGYLAARHLLDVGCRRIAYLGGPQKIRQVGDRLEGAQRAVAEVPDARMEVLAVAGLSVHYGQEAGQELVRRSPSERPEGVFAANDLLAIGILQALVLKNAVRVPTDIAVIGYDDIDFAAAAVVPLSSVRQPSRRLGQDAIRILLEETDDPDLQPQDVVFLPEVVVRASTLPSLSR